MMRVSLMCIVLLSWSPPSSKPERTHRSIPVRAG
jgi:hypothetical protein